MCVCLCVCMYLSSLLPSHLAVASLPNLAGLFRTNNNSYFMRTSNSRHNKVISTSTTLKLELRVTSALLPFLPRSLSSHSCQSLIPFPLASLSRAHWPGAVEAGLAAAWSSLSSLVWVCLYDGELFRDIQFPTFDSFVSYI